MHTAEERFHKAESDHQRSLAQAEKRATEQALKDLEAERTRYLSEKSALQAEKDALKSNVDRLQEEQENQKSLLETERASQEQKIVELTQRSEVERRILIAERQKIVSQNKAIKFKLKRYVTQLRSDLENAQTRLEELGEGRAKEVPVWPFDDEN